MQIIVWRHPKPINAEGICLGHTDLGVDKRKAKRLANRIQKYAKRHQLPKQIWVSPLQRSNQVGEILVARGWTCHIVLELIEINFGTWDGKQWQNIAVSDIDDWCDNFADYDFSKGESLTQLFNRVESWLKTQAQDDLRKNNPILAVGHAGWINVAKMLANGNPVPKDPSTWSKPVDYMTRSELEFSV